MALWREGAGGVEVRVREEEAARALVLLFAPLRVAVASHLVVVLVVVADLFDERDEAVKALLKMAIDACKRQGKYIGICGQGPSDHPDLAKWLVDQGIESMSLNPDSVIETWMMLAGESI